MHRDAGMMAKINQDIIPGQCLKNGGVLAVMKKLSREDFEHRVYVGLE